MNKYVDNSLVEEMDSIVLLNDNYANLGLHKGYIGIVAEYNPIEKIVFAEFVNPITKDKICEKTKIDFNDFRILNSSYADFEIRKKYAEKFLN